MTPAHSIVTLVLDLLNTHLEFPADTLPNLHRLQEISGDQVGFIRASPQPSDDRRTALGEHTDFGSIAALFNRLGRLQILPTGRNVQVVLCEALFGPC